MRRWWILGGAVVFVAASGTVAVSTPKPAAVKTVSFNRDVRPILSESCFKCHGFDAKEAKGNLRLNDPKDATRDRGGYRAITPGDVTKSMIMGRVTTTVEEMKMPPPHSGMKPLTPEQVEILKNWIQQGAKYEPQDRKSVV